MGDFPPQMIENIGGNCITPNGFPFATALQAELAVVNYAAAVWGYGNNGAVYVPFTLDQTKIAKQMFIEHAATAGNSDVGIYDAYGNRLVSMGSTANAGTLQIFNITDTTLVPGTYYAALAVSTIITETLWSAAIPVANLRWCGCQQQATALPLPATWTPAVVTNVYLPMVGISFQSVM